MPSNNPDYARAYNLTHRKKIKERKRRYYLKNRERLIAQQIIRNRKNRDARRAARASQKPVREQMRSVSQTDDSSPRDTPSVGWNEIVSVDEHGDVVFSVPRVGASGRPPEAGRVPDVPKEAGADDSRENE